MAKININAETKFVRSATFTDKEGVKVEMIFQPYAVSEMYLAIYKDKKIACQSSVSYSNLSKIVKSLESNLKKNNTDVVVNYSTIGNFLNEADLELLNGNCTKYNKYVGWIA